MLTELEDLQSSDEKLWGMPRVSFTIETRAEENNELVEREYTFSQAPEWDKWMFSEYEERRTPNVSQINRRNWRRARHIEWSEPDARQIAVPPEVTRKLEELLDLDEMELQI